MRSLPFIILFLFIISGDCNSLTHKFQKACSQGANEIGGNWYCSNSVKAVTYTGFQNAGTYSRVTSMSDGLCSTEPQNFNSPLGAFGAGNDISWHFRGPLQLNQFAQYSLNQPVKTKRELKPKPNDRRTGHGHSHFHKRVEDLKEEAIREIEKRSLAEIEKRGVCDLVSATFGTVVATWTNLWDGTTNQPSTVCAPKTIEAAQPSGIDAPSPVALATPNVPDPQADANNPNVDQKATTVTIRSGTKTSTIVNGMITRTLTLQPGTKTPESGSSQTNPGNTIDSSPTTEAPDPQPSPTTAPGSSAADPSNPSSPTSTTDSDSSSNDGSDDGNDSTKSTYKSIAMYNSADANSTGLAFLNNNGGQGSGVWDSHFGNSLSYASPDCKSGSPHPEFFTGYLDDGIELTIFTDTECDTRDPNTPCGYTRPGTVAHHGFTTTAAQFTLFLLDFSMPLTGSTGFNKDMPSIWILNAQIPRTLQYDLTSSSSNQQPCSCWSSGCGEFDVFEVLDSGNTKMKATWHGDKAGGSSYFFDRPTDKDQGKKAGVLMSAADESMTIFWVPEGAVEEFGPDIDEEIVSGWVEKAAEDGSLFTL